MVTCTLTAPDSGSGALLLLITGSSPSPRSQQTLAAPAWRCGSTSCSPAPPAGHPAHQTRHPPANCGPSLRQSPAEQSGHFRQHHRRLCSRADTLRLRTQREHVLAPVASPSGGGMSTRKQHQALLPGPRSTCWPRPRVGALSRLEAAATTRRTYQPRVQELEVPVI